MVLHWELGSDLKSQSITARQQNGFRLYLKRKIKFQIIVEETQQIWF